MAQPLARFVERQLRAACDAAYAERAAALRAAGAAIGPAERAARFAAFVVASAPAMVRFGVGMLACLLALSSLVHRRERAAQLAAWRASRLATLRDFVRFIDALVLFDMVQ